MKFSLEKYVESMAWKAASRNSDPSITIDDIRQEALIALWKAEQTFDPSRGAKPNTHSINMVKYRLASMKRKASVELPREQAYNPEPSATLRAEQALKHNISVEARLVLDLVMKLGHELETCTKREVCEILGISAYQLRCVEAELKNF